MHQTRMNRRDRGSYSCCLRPPRMTILLFSIVLVTIAACSVAAQQNSGLDVHLGPVDINCRVLYLSPELLYLIQSSYCAFGQPARITSNTFDLTVSTNGLVLRTPSKNGEHFVTYDQTGRLNSYADKGNEGISGYTYTYDGRGYLKRSQMVFNGELLNDPSNNTPEYYHYQRQGRTILITPTGPKGLVLPHADRETQTFDSNGKMTADVTYQGMYKDTEYDYTFLPNGLINTITQIEYGLKANPDMPTISNKWEYTYDRNGRLSVWTLINGDPSDPQTVTIRAALEYDNAGNVSKVTWKDGRVYTFTYQFDSMGNWTKQIWNRVTNSTGSSVPEREVDRVISYYPSEIGTITTDGLWIRSKPGLSATTMGFLNLEERVTVLETTTEKSTIDGKTSPWYRVRTATGLKGWIFGGYVTVRTEQ